MTQDGQAGVDPPGLHTVSVRTGKPGADPRQGGSRAVNLEPVVEKTRTADGAAQGPAQPEPIASIGRQLREARLALGMSVREMGRRVDVSASFISQLELGKTMPSVGTLYSIASELGLSLDDLMETAQSGDTAATDETAWLAAKPPVPRARAVPSRRKVEPLTDHHSPVQRAARRQELHVGGAIWGRLTADHDPANDFLHTVYKPGAESCPPTQMIHHRGFEYGYIVTGKLHVQVAFAHYDLEAGDSISFDSATPHRLSNPFEQESQSIWLVVGRGGTPVL
ncbi:MAG TPA: XRE family transcriptional regulator [Trebonia sp.]